MPDDLISTCLHFCSKIPPWLTYHNCWQVSSTVYIHIFSWIDQYIWQGANLAVRYSLSHWVWPNLRHFLIFYFCHICHFSIKGPNTALKITRIWWGGGGGSLTQIKLTFLKSHRWALAFFRAALHCNYRFSNWTSCFMLSGYSPNFCSRPLVIIQERLPPPLLKGFTPPISWC